jgi:hypothetical protein
MLHLTQVTAAPRPLNRDELLQEIGKSRKRVRRTSPENINSTDDDSNEEKDDVVLNLPPKHNQVQITKQIQYVQPPTSKNDLLDRAIQAKRAILKLLEERGNQEDIERTLQLRDQLMELYVSYYSIV